MRENWSTVLEYMLEGTNKMHMPNIAPELRSLDLRTEISKIFVQISFGITFWPGTEIYIIGIDEMGNNLQRLLLNRNMQLKQL